MKQNLRVVLLLNVFMSLNSELILTETLLMFLDYGSGVCIL